MIRRLLMAMGLLCCTWLTAHEFWLEPQKFNLKKGEALKLNFRVGENFHGENWNGTRASVESLTLYYNGIKDDLESLIPEEEPGDSLNLQFFDEGTGMISYHSTNKRIELAPDKFLEYLKEDGLDSAIAYREAHQETDSIGKEYYQRSVKTIFQVGKQMDKTYNISCGLPLEFIPAKHPYTLTKGQTLKLRLLYHQSPLKDVKVKVWHKLNGKVKMEEYRSNANGEIQFVPSLAGRYMVSAVHMQHIDTSMNTHWQSYWGSITWGY